MASKPLRQFFSVIKAECFIRASSVQFLSPVGIDVIHHQVYICLRQLIKAFSLWHNPPDEFMPHLYLRFLIRCAWITVVYPCPLEAFSIRSVLYAFRIGEFTSIVCEYHGEQPPEILPSQTVV